MASRNLNKKQLVEVINILATFIIPATWTVTYPPGIRLKDGCLTKSLLDKLVQVEQGHKIIVDLNALFTTAAQVRSIPIKLQKKAYQRQLKKISKLIHKHKWGLSSFLRK